MSNYFTEDEAEMFEFYKIPQALFTNPIYKKINSDAKILYGLLLKRNSLSIKNKWIDNNGYVYIYFSREEAMELIGISDKPVTKAFKELTSVDLIEEKRQGLGKANIIYVKKFISVDTKQSYLNRKKSDSGTVKNTIQQSEKIRGSNTELNYTESNTHTGSSKKDNLKTLCVELSSQIENILGEKIGSKKLESLIKECGLEKLNKYLGIWNKYSPFALKGQTNYFIHVVENELPVPQPQKKKNNSNNTVETFRDFDQREYSEEDFEMFYDNLNKN